jgi:hypothetical protein
MAIRSARDDTSVNVRVYPFLPSTVWTPLTPSPPSECVLPPHIAGRWGGWGVNIFEDARQRIGLLQYNLSTVYPFLQLTVWTWRCCPFNAGNVDIAVSPFPRHTVSRVYLFSAPAAWTRKGYPSTPPSVSSRCTWFIPISNTNVNDIET